MNRDELVNRLTNIAEKDPVKAVRLFEVIEMLSRLSQRNQIKALQFMEGLLKNKSQGGLEA